MARGQSDYSQLNELDINDLLAREPSVADEALLQSSKRSSCFSDRAEVVSVANFVVRYCSVNLKCCCYLIKVK